MRHWSSAPNATIAKSIIACDDALAGSAPIHCGLATLIALNPMATTSDIPAMLYNMTTPIRGQSSAAIRPLSIAAPQVNGRNFRTSPGSPCHRSLMYAAAVVPTSYFGIDQISAPLHSVQVANPAQPASTNPRPIPTQNRCRKNPHAPVSSASPIAGAQPSIFQPSQC